MAEKVVLVLIDGLRPDAFLQCGHPFVQKLISESSHALDATSVFPSVTFPCHMSLFHSVDPDRHGILTNTYVPQVRPIVGLFDQLHAHGKKNGFFYNWEQLRDLARPGHLHTALHINLHHTQPSDNVLTEACIEFINKVQPDFTFLYLGENDEMGHAKGWMSEEYLGTANNAMECVQRVYDNLPEGYTLILTADHGGHERTHGTTMPEDMTIPILFCGPKFEKNRALENVSLKDIAVTVAKLLDVPPVPEWEGTARC